MQLAQVSSLRFNEIALGRRFNLLNVDGLVSTIVSPHHAHVLAGKIPRFTLLVELERRFLSGVVKDELAACLDASQSAVLRVIRMRRCVP